MTKMFFLIIMILIILGCRRHVVVDPDQVESLKSTEWTIKSEPKPREKARPSENPIQAPSPEYPM